MESPVARLARFHHLGLAVKDFDAALRFYESAGYTAVARANDAAQRVKLILCEAPGAPRVELVKPLGPASPVWGYLERNNECIYHTCYETSDLAGLLQALKAQHRLLPVSKPKPAPLFGGDLVSFWYVPGVGILEFLERGTAPRP
jgi:methylmalonyl-CoA/ethylmalonyl-CoA epimerase